MSFTGSTVSQPLLERLSSSWGLKVSYCSRLYGIYEGIYFSNQFFNVGKKGSYSLLDRRRKEATFGRRHHTSDRYAFDQSNYTPRGGNVVVIVVCLGRAEALEANTEKNQK